MDSMEKALADVLKSMADDYSTFIDLGQAIGGLGSLFYIFYRVWAHLARNEKVDVYGLLRPVTMGLCLLFYGNIAGSVVALSGYLNEGTKPLVTSKSAIVQQLDDQKDQALEQKKKDIINANPDLNGDGDLSMYEKLMDYLPAASITTYASNAISYAVQKYFDEFLLTLGELAYNVASLTIKFLMTFFLLVLLIMGPITFGLACFEWFYGGLAAWISRVIHLLLWIPIVNVLGGILEEIHIVMLKADIVQIVNTPKDTFSSSDFGLIVFYIIGTVAYFMVPKVASWVIESAGADSAVKSLAAGGQALGAPAGAAIGAATGGAAGAAKAASGSSNSLPPPVNKV